MDEFQRIFEIIECRSGIRVNESHRDYIIDAVKKRPKFSSASEYALLLEQDESECSALVDFSTINETYFFREESQFDFLKEKILPKFLGKKIVVWSAACSSGEEAVSLYALSKSLGCQPVVFATDIDSNVLSKLREFKWQKNSFRSDGAKYMPILENFGFEDGDYFRLSKTEKANFHVSNFNLISPSPLPFLNESVDIVFLRNVFIYFSRENQEIALRRMWEALKPGGLLFLSVNEIASVDGFDEIPFVKEHSGSVYYLRKTTENEFKQIKNKKNPQKSVPNFISKDNPNALNSDIVSDILIEENEKTDFAPRNFQNAKAAAITLPSRKNAEAEKQRSSQRSIEEVAEEFLKSLAAKDFEKAEETLESYKFKSQNLEYKYYLLGRLYYEKGDAKSEQAILNKAVILNPRFWPAWMNLGLSYKRTDQTAKKNEAFTKCREILLKNISEGKTEYNFIVEAFDLPYFLKLCDYYLGK